MKSNAQGVSRCPELMSHIAGQSARSVMNQLLDVEHGELVLKNVWRHPADTSLTMSHWRVVEIRERNGLRVRYLLGQSHGQARVCPDVRQIDLAAMRVTLASGRQYELLGMPGDDFDADFLFAYWKSLKGIGRSRDLTRALLRLKSRLDFDVLQLNRQAALQDEASDLHQVSLF